MRAHCGETKSQEILMIGNKYWGLLGRGIAVPLVLVLDCSQHSAILYVRYCKKGSVWGRVSECAPVAYGIRNASSPAFQKHF